jgi:hypothetical protein
MTTEHSPVAALRQQIERKYREAIQALDTLAEYLEAPSAGSLTSHAQKPVKAVSANKGTTVERVLAVIGDMHKTVQEIHEETGLSEESVRAVLYSKFVRPKLHSKKVGKRTAFRVSRTPAVSASNSDAQNGEQKSAAALVRGALARHPKGLTAAEITATVGDQVEKMTGSKAAIGAALYNGKKRRHLEQDEVSGVYTLARAAR